METGRGEKSKYIRPKFLSNTHMLAGLPLTPVVGLHHHWTTNKIVHCVPLIHQAWFTSYCQMHLAVATNVLFLISSLSIVLPKHQNWRKLRKGLLEDLKFLVQKAQCAWSSCACVRASVQCTAWFWDQLSVPAPNSLTYHALPMPLRQVSSPY